MKWAPRKGEDEEIGVRIYELQQSPTAEFETPRLLYKGPDTGTFVSGLPEGSTYFRIRDVTREESPGPWSETLEVRVNYPAPWLVKTLVGFGTLLALILLTTIILGSRNARRSEQS